MGIREQLNEKPAITTGATIGIILLALIFIVYEIHGSGSGSFKIPTQRYYSDDDGASYFSDDIKLVAPFDHNGKPAVQAVVYRCHGGKPFVGYLQRYTDKGAQELRKLSSMPPDSPSPQQVSVDQIQMTEMEFSAPNAGAKGWVRAGSRATDSLMNVKCPDGSTETLEPVEP